MVMEATPSPQSVGREFVRQYYTLLNEMPAHLHRFYNQHSSFTHGGLDSNKESAPAIGQKQIHQKIQQLNFQDCHAKISQVDSQLTLENGVVIQVSGELSNAGQTMRRFTQTFVLAIQGPKSYYVHNDIFRYQDIIFPDEEEGGVGSIEGGMNETGEREVEEGSRSEPEEDEHTQAQQHSVAPPVNEPQPPLIAAQPPMPIYYAASPQQHVHPVMQQVINGTVHEEAAIITQPQVAPQPQPPQTQHQYIAETTNQTQFIQEPELETTTEQQVKEESQSPSEEIHEEQPSENFTPSAPEQESEHQVANTNVNNSEPKTYANLVKSYSNTTGSSSPSTTKLSMSPPPMSSLRLDDRSTLNQTGPSLSTTSSVSSAVQPQPQRVTNQQPPMSTSYQQRPPRTGGPVQRDGERRGPRPGQYSDAHQLFLGNLPHSATESDLREVFERYGKVAELRVHSKTNERGKGPQGGNSSTRLPNYGFITFEDLQVVNKVLSSLPIYYLDKNGQNQKLNVEEKKVRSRGSMDGSGGRISSGDNMRTMGGPQQSQQRGPGGPGGMMRGGQHNARGGRGGFSRGGDGGRGGGMRQSNNPNNASYQNRRS